jgi:hypothetical protein
MLAYGVLCAVLMPNVSISKKNCMFVVTKCSREILINFINDSPALWVVNPKGSLFYSLSIWSALGQGAYNLF